MHCQPVRVYSCYSAAIHEDKPPQFPPSLSVLSDFDGLSFVGPTCCVKVGPTTFLGFGVFFFFQNHIKVSFGAALKDSVFISRGSSSGF